MVICWHRLLPSCGDQFQQMMIFDLFDLVGKHDEAAVDFVELVTIKLMAQLLTAQAERVPP